MKHTVIARFYPICKKNCKKTILFGALFLLSSCFGGGVETRGTVKKYAHDQLFLKGGGLFAVGQVSEDWKQKATKYRALFFTHKKSSATMGVDSFCGSSADQAPLALLSKQLSYGFNHINNQHSSEIQIGELKGLLSSLEGIWDGKTLLFDSVVIFHQGCVIDFFYVRSPDAPKFVQKDFEQFYRGFKWLKNPKGIPSEE